MPYIKRVYRNYLETQIYPLDSGELNYTLTRIVDRYIYAMGKKYSTLNDVIGVLECVKQELYRRVISPYEDKKVKENGDVYDSL